MSTTALSIDPEVAHSLSLEAQFGNPNYCECRCIGVLPGRACTACNSTKWMKRCIPCNGSGKIFVDVRSGSQPRTDIHGPCMGRGWLPCQAADLVAMKLAMEEAIMEAETAPSDPPVDPPATSKKNSK